MNALVIMHVESEGPGTLGSFLENRGVRLSFGRLYAGDSIPPDVGSWDLIVSLGGPMNVYEEEQYPFLRDETLFLQTAILAGVPTLGVCLGAQMIAKAAGAQVVKSPEKEVGWGTVVLTDDGAREPLFRGLPRVLNVLQWHEDMFHIPAGGTLLASSDACPHQAFRFRNALGLQFHVEVTEDMLSEWFRGMPELDGIRAVYRDLRKDLEAQALTLYTNLLGMAP